MKRENFAARSENDHGNTNRKRKIDPHGGLPDQGETGLVCCASHRTRHDWNVANKYHDGQLREWIRAWAAERNDRERRDWLGDHPGKTAEDYEAARNCTDMDAEERKALAAWRARRGDD
jgi:hypothetical protein